MNSSESVIFEKLYSRLYELLHNLNRYVPNIGCEEILKVYEKLDITTVMIRYLKVTGRHNDLLKTQVKVNEEVENIFTSPLIILPGIDVSELWQNLSSGQKEKTWTYMRLVYLTGFQAIEQSHVSASKKRQEQKEVEKLEQMAGTEQTRTGSETPETSKTSATTDKKKIQIDPFIGVGSSNEEYSVEDTYKHIENLEDIKYEDPGLGSFASFLNLDKLIDVEKLTDQLKNMTQEDIEKATDSIQSLLSTHDPNTQSFLKVMLDKIQSELKSVDFSQGTSKEKLNKVLNIVPTVAKTMGPHVDNKNIDPKSMINNAKGLFQEVITNSNMDPEQQKQFSVLNSMFNNLTNDPSKLKNKKYVNDMLKQAGIDPKQMNKISKSLQK